MVSLTWEQVNAWRLSQHHLLERSDRRHLVEVVAGIGGMQAQLMSAAELALSARVRDLSATDVHDALWRDRTLVKTWAMRGTLHLLAASDFPLFIAGRSTLEHYRRSSWLKYHGVTLEELDALIEGVRTTLSDSGMTREQLADAIAEQMHMPHLRELLRSGWGALLKPAALHGYLCFGPNQGQNVTFVQPARWLGEWDPVEPEYALKEIARRYLRAYGPAVPEDFARWFGMEPSGAKRIFRAQALEGEIEEADITGWKAWALVSTLEQIEAMDAPQTPHVVRLLPNFDPYVIALYRQSERILPEAYRARVSRPQGWISPVVLVDGRIEGIWEYDKQRSEIVVKVEMFTPPAEEVRRGIEAEAKHLSDFLGAGQARIEC